VSLARVGFIAIPPGAKPGFDHADVHRQRRRIYVAHTGADRIEVLDCNARTYLRALPAALPGVAGVLIDEQQDAAPTSSCSPRSRSGRTRTGSPTTGRGASSTAST